MSTYDRDPEGPSGLEEPLSAPLPAAEPELDAYGVPVQDRPPAGTADWRALASLIIGVISVGLLVAEIAAHAKLRGYLVVLGCLLGFLAALTGSLMGIPSLDAGAKRIAKYGFLPGFADFIGMVIASGHGAALNDAP
jgi:hypothetical protein